MRCFSFLQSRAWALSLVGGMGCACQSSPAEADPGLNDLDPPTLAAEGATTAEGSSYEATDTTVLVGCDRRVTFHWGPRDGSGELPNWLLRPPGACGQVEPCGYLRVRIEDEAGATLAVTEVPLLDVLVALEPSAVAQARRVTAELISGQTQDLFLADEKPIRASWAVSFDFAECTGAAGSTSL